MMYHRLPDLPRNLKIIGEAGKLDKRFIKLNKDYLKPGQAEEINALRNEKMNELYRTLSRQAGL